MEISENEEIVKSKIPEREREREKDICHKIEMMKFFGKSDFVALKFFDREDVSLEERKREIKTGECDLGSQRKRRSYIEGDQCDQSLSKISQLWQNFGKSW